jgi:hypothetical protein
VIGLGALAVPIEDPFDDGAVIGVSRVDAGTASENVDYVRLRVIRGERANLLVGLCELVVGSQSHRWFPFCSLSAAKIIST